VKLYRVGGCVRDRLLGIPVNDIDWVVTGATTAQMLAAGYKSIGRDFPVFLHPESKQEYALARSERKTGPGYRGFEISADPATTIEQDLMRRDLTINAIAEDDQGNIIDNYDGRPDIAERQLPIVSPPRLSKTRSVYCGSLASRRDFTNWASPWPRKPAT
jgi:tRNA nucleotidyltransferase (CCA-adding enzyme)